MLILETAEKHPDFEVPNLRFSMFRQGHILGIVKDSNFLDHNDALIKEVFIDFSSVLSLHLHHAKFGFDKFF